MCELIYLAIGMLSQWVNKQGIVFLPVVVPIENDSCLLTQFSKIVWKINKRLSPILGFLITNEGKTRFRTAEPTMENHKIHKDML
jgi:hypothetical protein